MPNILSKSELTRRLEVVYDRNVTNKESRTVRKHNIDSFNSIMRGNLKYNKLERRMLLYTTLKREKIYIQYPGKESVGKKSKPFDFRPKIVLENGKMLQDIDFGVIWDVLEQIKEKHKDYLYLVANLFYRMSYMVNYEHYNKSYLVEEFEINNNISHTAEEKLDWYGISFEEDIWFTLNEYIGEVSLDGKELISFEGFIKYIDLLFQNEDCKYYYKNIFLDRKDNYTLSSGRNTSGAANLFILKYLEGNMRLSVLLNQFQKARGVPQIAKRDYSLVTKGSVLSVEEHRMKRGIDIK